jgi:integrase
MEDVIAAINRVSVITVGEPKPEHALAGWLGKGVAHRMESAGVRTIGELHAFILLRGFSWWKGVKGLGRVSAGHVTAWLQQNLSTLRLDWDPMVGVAPRSPEALVLAREVVKPDAGLVPMERYAVPMDPRLTGVSGANRARGPKAIRADNDIDAMGAWLEARAAGNPHTLRAYRKEAERLLHWCHKTRGMAVSDMMVEDASEYLRFLSEIGVSPRHHEWVGRAPSRLHAGWRPFRGRLSDRSIAAAQRILTSMFHFLWQTGYVASNPFAAGRRFKGTHRATTSLSHKALPDALAACIETLFDERTREEGDAGKRWRSVRAIYLLGMDCGLRRDEIASVRRDQLEFLPRKNVWRLTFTGKGDKERSVYPTRRLIDALRAHAEDRGMDFDAPGTGDRQRWCLVAPHNRIPDADTPLDQQGYHPGSITQIVKRLADSIEAWVRGNRSELPGQATQFRTHALRHTFGTRLVEKLPVNDVRIMMGHDSLDNTSMYLNTEEDALIDRVSGLL